MRSASLEGLGAPTYSRPRACRPWCMRSGVWRMETSEASSSEAPCDALSAPAEARSKRTLATCERMASVTTWPLAESAPSEGGSASGASSLRSSSAVVDAGATASSGASGAATRGRGAAWSACTMVSRGTAPAADDRDDRLLCESASLAAGGAPACAPPRSASYTAASGEGIGAPSAAALEARPADALERSLLEAATDESGVSPPAGCTDAEDVDSHSCTLSAAP